MTKFRITTLILICGVFIGLLFVTSCVSTTSYITTTGTTVVTTSGTTSTITTTGTAVAPPSFFDQYGIIIFIVVIFGLMYLLMIRPQRKRQKEQQKLMEDLKRGDQIITTSGIYGSIESVEDNTFVIKLESGATIRVVKGAVSGKRSIDR